MLGWSSRLSTSASRSIRCRARAMSLGRAVQGQALEGHLGAVGPPGQVDDSHAAPAEAGHPLVGHLTRVEAGDMRHGRVHDAWSSHGVGNLAPMTETEDVITNTGESITGAADGKAHDAVIDEALRLIDTGLSDLLHRELVSTDEVSDLLLDVRMLLTAAEMADRRRPRWWKSPSGPSGR